MTGLAESKSKDGQLGFTKSETYEYKPLPTREHTRVLVLEPGPNDSDDDGNALVGSLRLLDLCDVDSEPFEAISYVWGWPASTHSILVDGHPLGITPSLRSALLQTRLPDRSRTLWADAICIDQSDEIEKGHQVAAMGRIYKTSRRTLICLGSEHPEHARNTAGLIEDVTTMIEDVQRSPQFSGEEGSFPYPTAADPISTDPRWDTGWDVMMLQPWFERGWVVQEASLGPDACVLWASIQIGWISILRVNYWLVCRGLYAHQALGREVSIPLSVHHLDNFVRRHPEEAKLFDKRARETESASTLTMLFETRTFELSDPRDRIYAFMALETNDGIMASLQLEPDYQRTHLEIYHDFAVKYIKKTGDLDILSFIKHSNESLENAGRSAQAGRSPGPENVPSWVPRWDLQAPFILPLKSTLAEYSEDFTFAFLSEEASVIRVRGLILGSVEYTASQQPYCRSDLADLAPGKLIDLWIEVMETSFMKSLMNEGLNKGPYGGRQALAFFDVLCPIRQFSTFEKWLTSRENFARVLQAKLQGTERYYPRFSSEMMPAIATLAERIRLRGPRRFVILSQGYYGIAPPITLKGDVFAFIYGVETLSVLRPSDSRPGHYQVVGPIYVESRFVVNPTCSNMMGKAGCRDWEDWDLTEQDIKLC